MYALYVCTCMYIPRYLQVKLKMDIRYISTMTDPFQLIRLLNMPKSLTDRSVTAGTSYNTPWATVSMHYIFTKPIKVCNFTSVNPKPQCYSTHVYIHMPNPKYMYTWALRVLVWDTREDWHEITGTVLVQEWGQVPLGIQLLGKARARQEQLVLLQRPWAVASVSSVTWSGCNVHNEHICTSALYLSI